jgi:hypothetical protein
VANQKPKQPNAQKHGVFAATAILPGEHRQEFEELHSAVTQEWTPDGATEEDAVLTIAKAIWRKRRVQKFLGVQLAINALNPKHPSFDESIGLIHLLHFMGTEPEDFTFEDQADRFLRPDKIQYLRQKVPRSNFESTAEWVQAVINEISLVLLPASMNRDEPEMADVVGLSRSAANLSNDLFKQELALDERLDAMIDRAVKRLIQTKAMKQMLGRTGAGRVDAQPRTIVARETLND